MRSETGKVQKVIKTEIIKSLIKCTLFLMLFVLWPLAGWTQTNKAVPRVEGNASALGRNLYEITADAAAGSSVSGLRRELELRFDVYNRLFRFDPSRLAAPLRVRVFGDKTAYDKYIVDRLGETRPGAVYLHYNEGARRELVINQGSPDAGSVVSHQAFIQYLRAFVPNPPGWMREGFAIYFSTLSVDAQGKTNYEENLLYLDPAKSLGGKLPSAKTILSSDVSKTPPKNGPQDSTGVPEDFQIASWALVSFLLSGNQDYFRALTDSFMLLSPSAGAAANSQAVLNRFAVWYNFDAMDRDFRAYLVSRKTYRELIEDGQKAYSLGDSMNAELAFMTAMDQRPSEYAPYYYLGLISYGEKDYDTAEQYYLSSLAKGADEALVNYALGVNAAAAGRAKDAGDYLRKAARADPAKYQTKVDELLKKIGE